MKVFLLVKYFSKHIIFFVCLFKPPTKLWVGIKICTSPYNPKSFVRNSFYTS